MSFKIVLSLLPNPNEVRANHGIFMFIIVKDAYFQMKELQKSLIGKINLFEIPKYFQ
jgi:hypothetical protein